MIWHRSYEYCSWVQVDPGPAVEAGCCTAHHQRCRRTVQESLRRCKYFFLVVFFITLGRVLLGPFLYYIYNLFEII